MKTKEATSPVPCQRCGLPIEPKPDYPPVCDDCYPIYGACCNEWGNDDDSASD